MQKLNEPTSFWTDEDRQWMAGFFEGEGSVSRSSYRDRPYCGLIIGQVNPEPLVRVHSLCGGTVHRKSVRKGSPNAQPFLIWRCSGVKARNVAREIHPYLSKKRKTQIQPLLDWEAAPRLRFCKHGHEFTDENTIRSTLKTGRKRRHCRECMRASDRRRWHSMDEYEHEQRLQRQRDYYHANKGKYRGYYEKRKAKVV